MLHKRSHCNEKSSPQLEKACTVRKTQHSQKINESTNGSGRRLKNGKRGGREPKKVVTKMRVDSREKVIRNNILLVTTS